MQFPCFLRHHPGEVFSLADIVFEVVQLQGAVLEVFDELPVTGSYRAAGPRPEIRISGAFGSSLEIRGEVPEDGFAVQGVAALEQR